MSGVIHAGIVTGSIERAGKRMRGHTATCSDCGASETIPDTKFKGLPPDAVAGMFAKKGWEISRRGDHQCPSCSKKPRKITKEAPVADAPREMTPADKRAIFREIDGHYDERLLRYIGGETDQTIAKRLGFPRAWVADVREAEFGPAGVNEDMDKLKAAIGQGIAQARDAANAALKAAAVAEEAEKTLVDYRKRLDDIERAVGPRRVA